MRQVYMAFCGALLVLALAGITPGPAQAAHYYDTACNCMRATSSYTTRRLVRGAPIVRTTRRIVNRTRVVRGRTRLIQHNRLIVHVRPVIHRVVIVHRTHTIVRDVVLHRTNTINRYRNVYRNQVVNVRGGGTVRHVTVYRNVRGINCNCGDYSGRSYSSGYGDERVVHYRD